MPLYTFTFHIDDEQISLQEESFFDFEIGMRLNLIDKRDNAYRIEIVSVDAVGDYQVSCECKRISASTPARSIYCHY